MARWGHRPEQVKFRVFGSESTLRTPFILLYRATEAGLAATRPGITCAELFASVGRVVGGDGGAGGSTMVHEEDIVVREGGAELLLRRAPRALPVLAGC